MEACPEANARLVQPQIYSGCFSIMQVSRKHVICHWTIYTIYVMKEIFQFQILSFQIQPESVAKNATLGPLPGSRTHDLANIVWRSAN